MDTNIDLAIKAFINKIRDKMWIDAQLNADIRNLIISVVNDAIKKGDIPSKR